MTVPTSRSSVWIVFISLGASLLLTIASIAAWLNAASTPPPVSEPEIVTELPLRLTGADGAAESTGLLRVTASRLVAPGSNAYVQLVLDALTAPAGSASRQAIEIDSRLFTESQRVTARLDCPTTAFAECAEPRDEDRFSESGRLDWTWLLTPTEPSGDQAMTLSVFVRNPDGGESTIYSIGFVISIGRAVQPMGYIVAAALATIATIVLFGGLILARMQVRTTK